MSEGASDRQPLFSIITPAYNAAHLLPRTLGAIVGSDMPRSQWELVVVDDASTDDTAVVAARYADTVVRLPGKPRGPAYARNRGVEVSRGKYLAFFDADVVVHRDTLSRFAEILRTEENVGAVFGAYDTRPPEPGLWSQYRNLVHHYVHTQNAGDVDTFWAGAGVVDRAVFDEAGMYDEWHFARPQIEDIELGSRIRSLGRRIILRPDVQVTHLKKWTFLNVVRTDLRDRGIPWARLLAHRGTMLTSGSLNLRFTEKLNTILVWLSLVAVLLAIALGSTTPLFFIPVFLAAIAVINHRLHRFFLRERGFWFALAVFPVHLLYYVLNGISVAFGMFLHQTLGPPAQDPTVEAFAEVGVRSWPPVPQKNRRSSWTTAPEDVS
jgi:glycosyltransferase involved in cell wall biosynthesis